MARPTVINGACVFDSEGTLALMINGIDVMHLSVLRDRNGKVFLTDEEHQQIIDIIITALGVSDE